MKLHHSPTSPYVRKIMVMLQESGAHDQVTMVSAVGSPLDSSKMPVAQNPLGKIPCLERENEPALYDSRVISRYLDETLGAGFYPPAPAIWDILVLEATADGMLDAAILMVYEARLRPEEKQFEEFVEGQWNKIARALDALESRWMPTLSGPMTMGHIAVGCALEYLDFRLGERSWQTDRPQLAAWAKTFSDRPSMRDTVPT